jgi:hypothetical protein
MLILGSGVRGKGGGMILLYTSSDLRHWTYLHPLIEGPLGKSTGVNPVDTGEMWSVRLLPTRQQARAAGFHDRAKFCESGNLRSPALHAGEGRSCRLGFVRSKNYARRQRQTDSVGMDSEPVPTRI